MDNNTNSSMYIIIFQKAPTRKESRKKKEAYPPQLTKYDHSSQKELSVADSAECAPPFSLSPSSLLLLSMSLSWKY